MDQITRSLCTRVLLATSALWLASSSSTLYAQGYLVGWGYGNANHILDLPGSDYLDLAVGLQHVVALRFDGSLASSGVVGTPEVVNTPSGTGFTQVAAGGAHSLAIRQNGSIAAWGITSGVGYDHGQVTNAPTGTGFVQVSCSGQVSLALRADGSIVAWGPDDYGHVSNAPIETDFIQISAGLFHSMALRSDGSIVSWGWDGWGIVSNTPAGIGFTQVEVCPYTSLALRADGSIAAWGRAAWTTINAPTDAGYVLLASGDGSHAMALRADGSIRSWGIESANLLAGTPLGSGYSMIAGGEGRAIALKGGSSGSPFCVGDGTGSLCPCISHGQLGEGCANSTLSGGARLRGSGRPALTSDNFRVDLVGAPSQRLGVLLQAHTQLNGGLGHPVGDGLLCIGGNLIRSQVQATTTEGTARFSNFNGSPFGASSQGAGVPTHYQFWYRDPDNQCSGRSYNFSNAWTVIWSL